MQNIKSRLKALVLSVVASVAGAALEPGLVSAEQEPIKVVAGRYIITRKTTHRNATDTTQANYSTTQSTGYFDVVVPKSLPKSALSVTAPLEDLNWSKVAEHCKEIEQDQSVESCEPDIVIPTSAIPDDPLFMLQWGLHDPIKDGDIDVMQAWERGTGSKSVVVGVIDSGIYYEHPDLLPNLWINPSEPFDGIDNDGNGYVDDFIGINAHYGTNNPQDCAGHGTHVAGIIGAKGNNKEGATGVNWNSSLLAVSASIDCMQGLSTAAVIAGFNYLYDLKVRGHNIRVINGSFGSFAFSPAMYQAISRLNTAGVLVVAAAGNSANNNYIQPVYPASYELPNIISVAATNRSLALANYSNYGPDVDIAAPGGQGADEENAIVSTFSPLAKAEAFYVSLAGTSMAAPMVTGALALVASQAPKLSASQLKEVLLQSAYRVDSLEGLVDAARFMNVAGMSDLAASLSDECPNDPNKVVPGGCGCGVPDFDSDGDGTLDCQDTCSNDKAKTAPGACGCGIADTDSDRDGIADCRDACPNNSAKTSPGICGCGIADSDANGNGRIDCLDVAVGQMVPKTPTLRKQGRNLLISMAPQSGSQYYVQVTVSPPRGSRRKKTTGYYEVKSPEVLVRGIEKGAKTQVRYAYMVVGYSREFSYWSAFAKKTL